MVDISINATKVKGVPRGRPCPFGNSQWPKNYIPPDIINPMSKAKELLHANGGNYHKLSRDLRNFKLWDV